MDIRLENISREAVLVSSDTYCGVCVCVRVRACVRARADAEGKLWETSQYIVVHATSLAVTTSAFWVTYNFNIAS